MSRYEQICSMIRERRAQREPPMFNRLGLRSADGGVLKDREIVQVIHDAILEMYSPAFEHDAYICSQLSQGIGVKNAIVPNRLLMNRLEEQWPLQSELDA